ncbi:MAG: FG-GAP-like repeat-containing protein [Candidatus Cloacimonetes bacterium]|nr:FG-GAP-like repeat-containing protein [Candidatus Cloacimonadota bacterium]MDY0172381.1 FG-GAP and VCBS repeat-containing protein [Candidatus Cloacimonadaceae bacterium]
MKKLILYISAILMIVLLGPLSAQNNHLDVMTYMSGEFGGCEFGESIASLDCIGDGYMDLVVSSGAWNPNLVFADQNRWGKLYFYWGGPNFDNIPDFVIPGAYNWQMGPYASVFNGGDMNGDGIDDLIMFQRSATYDNNVALFFGRANPHNSPDILLTYSYNSGTGVNSVAIIPIGDINGDNQDDICLVLYYAVGSKEVCVWTDYLAQPWLFRQTINSQSIPRLSGIGDANNDGFDDTLLHISNNPSGGTHNRLVLYYGSPTFPQTDSLTICEDSNSIIKSWACPLGDVNGDGYDDFSAGSQVYDYSQHLWLGGEVITENWSLDLSAAYPPPPSYISERGSGYPMVHGDLNGDGYQDVIGFDHEAGYYSGYLYIWMGSSAMNGSLDFVSLGITNYDNRNYGWSKATGDFNADGYCDIAVGAPWFGPLSNHNSTGRVYIMAGNADLHETTVANSDETAPVSNVEEWHTDIYPNPVTIQEPEFSILFKGSGYKATGRYRLEMYNIKGQKLLSQAIHMEDIKDGGLSLESGKLPKGVLIISISKDGIPVSTRKLTNY